MPLPNATAVALTMLFGEAYLPWVRCLASSVRTHSTAPLVVLHGANESHLARGLPYTVTADELFSRIRPPAPSRGRRLYQWSAFKTLFRYKFLAWTLVEYERVLFLDADTFVLRSVEALFAMPMQSALSAVACSNASFNSGVLLLRPSLETARVLMERRTAARRGEMKITDQSILNRVFPSWQRLPDEYNVARHAAAFRATPHDALRRGAAIIHVVGEPKTALCGYGEEG